MFDYLVDRYLGETLKEEDVYEPLEKIKEQVVKLIYFSIFLRLTSTTETILSSDLWKLLQKSCRRPRNGSFCRRR